VRILHYVYIYIYMYVCMYVNRIVIVILTVISSMIWLASAKHHSYVHHLLKLTSISLCIKQITKHTAVFHLVKDHHVSMVEHVYRALVIISSASVPATSLEISVRHVRIWEKCLTFILVTFWLCFMITAINCFNLLCTLMILFI